MAAAAFRVTWRARERAVQQCGARCCRRGERCSAPQPCCRRAVDATTCGGGGGDSRASAVMDRGCRRRPRGCTRDRHGAWPQARRQHRRGCCCACHHRTGRGFGGEAAAGSRVGARWRQWRQERCSHKFCRHQSRGCSAKSTSMRGHHQPLCPRQGRSHPSGSEKCLDVSQRDAQLIDHVWSASWDVAASGEHMRLGTGVCRTSKRVFVNYCAHGAAFKLECGGLLSSIMVAGVEWTTRLGLARPPTQTQVGRSQDASSFATSQ